MIYGRVRVEMVIYERLQLQYLIHHLTLSSKTCYTVYTVFACLDLGHTNSQ